MDIKKYPEWNPYHVKVQEKLDKGETLAKRQKVGGA